MTITRQRRLLWWILAVAAAAATPLVARAATSHGLLPAAVWLVGWLSAILAMLATTPRNAIKLPSIASELIVLGGMIGLHWATVGKPSWTPVPALLVVIVNHTALTAQTAASAAAPRTWWSRWHLVPAFNLWPLAPMVWHPALWLTSKGPMLQSLLTKSAWAGAGLAVAAGLASSLVQRPGRALPFIGWLVWAAIAVVTASFF